MITKEIAEQLATILSHLQCLPTMHGSVLFSNDIAEFMGFQIQCDLNKNGRLVYAVIDTENFPNAQKEFASKYKECYNYEVKTPKIPIISEKQIYPTTGSDSVYDIAPGTLTRLLMIESEFNPEEATAIPVFIMNLAEETEKWEKHFRKMSENLGSLRTFSEQIYEKLITEMNN